jgi:hypothetical protein
MQPAALHCGANPPLHSRVLGMLAVPLPASMLVQTTTYSYVHARGPSGSRARSDDGLNDGHNDKKSKTTMRSTNSTTPMAPTTR